MLFNNFADNFLLPQSFRADRTLQDVFPENDQRLDFAAIDAARRSWAG